MSNEMRLRPAVGADLPGLTDLWMDMMAEHLLLEPRIKLSESAAPSYQSYLLLHLCDRQSLVSLVEREGDILGYFCLYICQNLPMFQPERFGYVSDLYVVPHARRQGVGNLLVERAKRWFREQGVTCAQLQVYRKNETGQAFWRAQGFESSFERMWMDLGDATSVGEE